MCKPSSCARAKLPCYRVHTAALIICTAEFEERSCGPTGEHAHHCILHKWLMSIYWFVLCIETNGRPTHLPCRTGFCIAGTTPAGCANSCQGRHAMYMLCYAQLWSLLT